MNRALALVPIAFLIAACGASAPPTATPERVVVPVESNGYRVIAFAPPGSNMTAACERSAVINVSQGTEHKIGSDSPRAWIAAQKGDTVILEYAVADDPTGDYPDSGCRVEMYANKGLG